MEEGQGQGHAGIGAGEQEEYRGIQNKWTTYSCQSVYMHGYWLCCHLYGNMYLYIYGIVCVARTQSAWNFKGGKRATNQSQFTREWMAQMPQLPCNPTTEITLAYPNTSYLPFVYTPSRPFVHWLFSLSTATVIIKAFPYDIMSLQLIQ